MRSHGGRTWTRMTTVLAMLLVVALAPLALDACDAATSGVAPAATLAVTPSPTASKQSGASAAVTWTAFASDGAIQVWLAAPGSPPRLLATLTQAFPTCQMIAAGLPMLSPDGAHLLVSEGEQCDLTVDPGPLLIVDVASGRSSIVPLPDGTTVLPQVRSYGWVDNHTLFAFSQYNYTNVFSAYLYTLGAGQAEKLAGLLDTPLEGLVRGSTLFYLQVTSGDGGIQSILRRYDLAHRAPLPGGIDLGAYAVCGECPDMVTSPGWDVAADGSHVVFQRTMPRTSGSFGPSGGAATSQIFSATADGTDATSIAQSLATSAMVYLRLSPDGQRVAITAPYPTPTIVTACVDSPGTKGDPCFATYHPGASSMAAWSADGRSFLAATVDASYGPPMQPGSLVRYTLGSAIGQPIAVAYGPWSAS